MDGAPVGANAGKMTKIEVTGGVRAHMRAAIDHIEAAMEPRDMHKSGRAAHEAEIRRHVQNAIDSLEWLTDTPRPKLTE